MEKLLLEANQRPKTAKWILLSLQHVFAMFGATVLVPLLTGLNVGVTLIASGLGTLVYIVCTKGKVPVYLGSSFAYIGAIIASAMVSANAAGAGVYENITQVTQAIKAGTLSFTQVYSSAFVGLMIVGLIYCLVALAIRFAGSAWLKKLLPPVVIGPMIIIIGLGLAPVAIGSAGLDGSAGWQAPVVAMITFAVVVAVAMFGKGFVKIVPFLIAVVAGYVVAVAFGLVDLEAAFAGAAFLQFPSITLLGTYTLNWGAALMFAPLSFVTIAEHIGDHSVLGEICHKDFITDPGLDKTLLGDGIATFLAGAIGGPANTTYGENTGVVAMTRVGSVWVTGLAAVFAIVLGFFGWIQAFILSIPWAVIGGMTVVLYGLIAGNGVKVLIKARTNLGNMKNLIVVSTMLVIGLGGAALSVGTFSLTGMSLAAIVGIILNLVLPNEPENISIE
ncbi:MAG: NCS2 family nucleobase:cation symporter [Bacillus subtilis]|nr:NCS2 family nucleobase:cation symporter [Bacillus subtilis]